MEIRVSAQNISFSKRKFMLNVYRFRGRNSCFGQKHIVFEEEYHVFAKTRRFRKGTSCFGKKHIVVEDEIHVLAKNKSFPKRNSMF